MIDSQQSSSVASYQATIPASLTGSQVTVRPADMLLNRITQYDFTLTLPMPLPVGAYIDIKIPLEIGLYSDAGALLLSSAAGQVPLYKVLSETLVGSGATKKIRIGNLVPSSQYYVNEGQTIEFTLFNLKNPLSSGLTSSFQMEIYDSDSLSMTLDEAAGVKVSIQAGELKSLVITPETFRTRQPSSYTFSFVLSNPVPPTGSISISLPPEMSVSTLSGGLTLRTLQNLATSATITSPGNNVIQIKNCFPSQLPSGTYIQFSIPTGLSNPYTSKQLTTPFSVSTLSSGGVIIDTAVGLKLQATPNEIPQVIVTACNGDANNAVKVASQTNMLCTYQLRILMSSALGITSGSYIEVEVPQEIGFPATTQEIRALIAGTYTEGLEDSKRVVSVVRGRTVRIESVFNPNNPAKTEYNQDMFAIYLGGLVTPRSTQPTSSFKVRIFEPQGYLSYKKESLATSQVSQAQPFTKVALSRSSEINGDKNVTIDFTLTLSQAVFKNEFLKITPPDQVKILASTKDQCRGLTNLAAVLGCSVNNQSLFITITPSDPSVVVLPAGSIIRFTVSGIMNPTSQEPSDSFMIFVTSSRIYDYYINQITNGLSVVNREGNALRNVEVLPDSSKLSTITNYAFYFTTTNDLGSGSSIEIEFPSQVYQAFATQSIGCQALKNLKGSNLQCLVKTSNKNVIQVLKGFGSPLQAGSQMGVKLQGIKNPSKSTSITEEIQITTLTRTGYLVDQGKSKGFRIGCSYPCASCSSDQTKCTSCLTSEDVLGSQLYLFGLTCGQSCPSGYYNDRLNTCQKCSYPCQNCFDSASHCTQCLRTSQTPYLNQDDSKCYSNCPSGMYSSDSSLQCELCSANCLECSGSPSSCISCRPQTPFIWEQKCFAQCPNTTVALRSEDQKALGKYKECQACKKPCQTCSNLRDNCTTCQLSPVTYYLFGNQCLEQCPRMYIPDSNNVCSKSDETTYPFLSFTVSGSIILLVFLSNRVYPNTRAFSSYLALQSAAMLLIWAYLLVFLVKDSHWSSSFIVVIAFSLNVVINCYWHAYYLKHVKATDQGFQRHQRAHPCSSRIIVIVSFLFTFQLFRLQYSRLFNSQALSCTLDFKDRFYKKLNRYSLLQMTVVYLPIISANIYNLQWTWFGRQVFWVDIECIATTCLLLIMHVVVIMRTEQLFVSDKYEYQGRGGAAAVKPENAQLSLETGPTPADGVEDKDARGRQIVLKTILEKVKKNNRDMFVQLNGGSSCSNQLEQSQSIGELEEQIDEIMVHNGSQTRERAAGYDSRSLQDKKYVTLGVLQGHRVREEHQKLLAKAALKNHISDPKRQFYNQIQQETSADLGDFQDIEEEDEGDHELGGNGRLENNGQDQYTSVPLDPEKVMRENMPARKKFNKFKKELDQLVGKGDKKGKANKRGKSSSPKRKSNDSRSRSNSKQRTKRKKATEDTNTASAGVAKTNQARALGAINEVWSSGVKMPSEDDIERAQTKSLGVEVATKRIVESQEHQRVEIPNTNQLREDQQEIPIDASTALSLAQDLMKSRDIGMLSEKKLKGIADENQSLMQVISEETKRKEELQIMVDDLHEQVASLLQAFNLAAQRREEELALIEKANFTSDEDEMGITPSNYNYQNQRPGTSDQVQQISVHSNTELMVMNDSGGSSQNVPPTLVPYQQVVIQESVTNDGNLAHQDALAKAIYQSSSDENPSHKRAGAEAGVLINVQSTQPSMIAQEGAKNQTGDGKGQQRSKGRKHGKQKSNSPVVQGRQEQVAANADLKKETLKRVSRKTQAKSVDLTGKPQSSGKTTRNNRFAAAGLQSKPGGNQSEASPDESKSRSKSGRRRRIKTKSPAKADEEEEPETKVKRKRYFLRLKKKNPDQQLSPEEGKKRKRRRRRRRWLKKKKILRKKKGKRRRLRKGKKGRKKAKKGGGKSLRSKSKQSQRTKKPQSAAMAKVAPMPQTTTGGGMLDDTQVHNFDEIIITTEMDDDGFQDIDQLSVSMTQSEFADLLAEENGHFILEDLTEQLREDYSQEMSNMNFTMLAKDVIKQLATKSNHPTQQLKNRMKLREHIEQLNLKARNHFEWEKANQGKQTGDDMDDLASMIVVGEEDDQMNGPGGLLQLPTQDGLLPKTKFLKKKRKNVNNNQQTTSYDAYFNYLPFEKAVIESKGKAPYTNRDAEQIILTKRQQQQVQQASHSNNLGGMKPN